MDTFVSPRATDEGRLFGIVCVRFGDRTSRDESLEQVTFDCFLVMRPATPISAVLFPASRESYEQLHSPIPCPRVSDQDRDLFLRPSLFRLYHILGEFGSVDGQLLIVAIFESSPFIRLLVFISRSFIHFRLASSCQCRSSASHSRCHIHTSTCSSPNPSSCLGHRRDLCCQTSGVPCSDLIV